MKVLLSNEYKRLLRFAIVGASGTIIDFGFFNLLINIFRFRPVYASVFSFTIAVFNNFLWNRVWTYPESKLQSFIGQLFQFGIISLIGLIIRTPIFVLLENSLSNLITDIDLGFFIINAESFRHNLSLSIAIVIVLFWNYFANRYWTYRNIK